jgi:hypothetical protein
VNVPGFRNGETKSDGIGFPRFVEVPALKNLPLNRVSPARHGDKREGAHNRQNKDKGSFHAGCPKCDLKR